MQHSRFPRSFGMFGNAEHTLANMSVSYGAVIVHASLGAYKFVDLGVGKGLILSE